MKWISLFLTVLFALVAVLQFNDPDRVYWIAMYGAPAVCSGLHYFGKPSRLSSVLCAVVLAIALVWGIRLFPDFQKFMSNAGISDMFSRLSMKTVTVEKAREFIGLLFIGIACIFELFHATAEGVLDRSE